MALRASLTRSSRVARGEESGRGYSRDYDRPSSRRPSDYSDDYATADDGYADDYSTGSSTVGLPPPRGFDEDEQHQSWRIAWHSGADLGLLIMRLVLGCILAAHGAQKVFGWFGGAGLDGFATFLADQGYQQSDALSAAGAFAELVGGLLVILGVFTPLAAAGLLSVMVNAIWPQWDSGLFAENGGFELELALAGLAVGLIFTGPGRISLDNGRAWFRHPVTTAWLCLIAGTAAGVAVYIVYHGS